MKRAGTTRMAPEQVAARHPAFDVTPARYVTALITERGVFPVNREGLAALARARA